MVDTYQLVDVGPQFTPLRYGLLSVAQEIPDSDPHWQQGTVLQGDLCTVPATVTGGPCRATSITKVPSVSGIPSTAADPFAVYGWIQCAPVGHGDNLDDLVSRTRQLLTNGEGRAVEAVFWTGNASNGVVMPHLAEDTPVNVGAMGSMTVELQSAATVVSGSPLTPVQALSVLEGALAACYGGEGVIHVPAGAVAQLDAFGLVRAEGAMLRTKLGNKVAAYASGNRQGPTGANPSAGLAWWYATGAVVFRRSPIKELGRRPGDFVGRSKNETVFIAERTYVLDWDCCHLAQQVVMP